jgi:hypothetical protein
VRAVETMQGRFPTVSYITAEEATGEEEWNSAPKKRQLLDSDEEEDDEGRRQGRDSCLQWRHWPFALSFYILRCFPFLSLTCHSHGSSVGNAKSPQEETVSD